MLHVRFFIECILAGIAGSITIIAIIVLISSIVEYFIPLPVIELGENNITHTRQLFIHSSIGLLLSKLLAGIIGGLSGGLIISLLRGNKKTTIIVAIVFSLLAAFYMVMIIRPVWFWLLLVLSFFPSTLGGYLLTSFSVNKKDVAAKIHRT